MRQKVGKRHAQRPADRDEEPEEEPVKQQQKRRKLESRQLAAASDEDSEPNSVSEDTDSQGSDSDEGASSDREREPEGNDIPFGELEKLRQDGSTSAAAMKARARMLKGTKKSFKREGRHRPMEMSSKKPVPIFREAFQGPKREVRDPRFESLSGKYNEEGFKRRYAFLYDEKLPHEKKEIKTALQKVKNPDKRADLQAQLTHIDQQLRNEEVRRRKANFDKEVKAKEKEAVGAGKRPFFLKKSEKKQLELVAKYEALKASGGLEKYMAKRRKKNAAKDHRYLPVGRRQGGRADE